MSTIICELRDLQDHLAQVAATMRAVPDETGNHQRHADELEGAAAMCREWIEVLEESKEPVTP